MSLPSADGGFLFAVYVACLDMVGYVRPFWCSVAAARLAETPSAVQCREASVRWTGVGGASALGLEILLECA